LIRTAIRTGARRESIRRVSKPLDPLAAELQRAQRFFADSALARAAPALPRLGARAALG
jgi:hypothetical protein